MIYVLFLLTINILLLRLMRQDWKYWLTPIIMWSILIITFILWRSHQDSKYKGLESSYWESAENKSYGDARIYKQMDESKKYVQKYNLTFIHAISLQTILTFTFQIIGYHRTPEKRLYKWTSISFGILTFLTLIFELMLGIVPNGGIIG